MQTFIRIWEADSYLNNSYDRYLFYFSLRNPTCTAAYQPYNVSSSSFSTPLLYKIKNIFFSILEKSLLSLACGVPFFYKRIKNAFSVIDNLKDAAKIAKSNRIKASGFAKSALRSAERAHQAAYNASAFANRAQGATNHTFARADQAKKFAEQVKNDRLNKYSIKIIHAEDYSDATIEKVNDLVSKSGISGAKFYLSMCKDNKDFHSFFAVSEENEIVGVVIGEKTLTPYESSHLYIHILSVNEMFRSSREHRSKEKVGTRLMLHMFAYAQTLGLQHLSLTASMGVCKGEVKKEYQEIIDRRKNFFMNTFEKLGVKTTYKDEFDEDHNEWDRKINYYLSRFSLQNSLARISQSQLNLPS